MIKEVKDGILYFDGCNMVELSKEYKTPLYVLSQTQILNRFNELRESFLSCYENTRVAYAAKAFCSLAMIKLCEQEGMCIDVVSGGELYAAKKACFPPDRIEFNGNNKLPHEIEEAIEYGIGRIIIDGLQELDLIETICKAKQKKMNVLFRVTPGVAANSHDYIVTGKKDSKFGIPLDEEIFYPKVEKALHSPYVNFLGLHFHIGSQLFDNKAHLKALDVVLQHVREINHRFHFKIKELNLGGGFGAVYHEEQHLPYSYFIDPMMQKIKETFTQMNAAMPSIVIEPGRSIIAEAGISLYTIGSIKDIKGVRKYISVDGGMTDNIRPALYQADYYGVIANKMDEAQEEKVTICGKCCESGDILIKDLYVPKSVTGGDLFAMFSTGAYGYSMASNYNNNPIPAVVLVNQGKSQVIVNRQSYDDILANNILPHSLK